MNAPPVVAVVGGGIAGLSGALKLADAGAKVVVLEATDRLGGKILTQDFEGLAVDTGPDAFLARAPQAVELCRRLGLAGELVAPATGSASVWVGGRLRRLPEGLVLGVPTRWGPLARSGILSPAGLARATMDLILPAPRPADPEPDRSVAGLVGARLGRQVVDRLVGPLVGGINAGRAEQLSARAAAPALEAAARADRSLVLALRRSQITTPSPPGPVFLTHPRGLSVIVDALVSELESQDVELRTRAPVTSLGTMDTRWALASPTGPIEADGVLLAVPAFVASPLLNPHAPRSGALLHGINYASVALVTLAHPATAAAAAGLTGSGYLVPASDGRQLSTACTFSSRKWAHLATPHRAVFRISVGRWGDDRHLDLDDAELVDIVQAELARAVGIRGEPVASKVSRWRRSFPQYEVGHAERIAGIEADVGRLRTVALAGAAYRGVGIPACIRGAQAAAGALCKALGLE